MAQPPVSTNSRFTFRVDLPDILVPDEQEDTVITCDMTDLGKHLAHLVTMLNMLTEDESPMIVEIRRVDDVK